MLHDDPTYNKPKLPMDLMYKSVQIHIWRAFGFQYEFAYGKQIYAGQYGTLEHAKSGAMKAVDELFEKKI